MPTQRPAPLPAALLPVLAAPARADGRPVRKLSFEIPVERLPEAERKYVSKFDATLEVWIAADGTPLSSRLRSPVSGRAFLVVGFEQQSDDERGCALAGDRLVLARKHEQGKTSGADERQEYRTTTTMRLPS